MSTSQFTSSSGTSTSSNNSTSGRTGAGLIWNTSLTHDQLPSSQHFSEESFRIILLGGAELRRKIVSEGYDKFLLTRNFQLRFGTAEEWKRKIYNPSEYGDEVVLNLTSAHSHHHHPTCLYRVECQQGPQHNFDQATDSTLPNNLPSSSSTNRTRTVSLLTTRVFVWEVKWISDGEWAQPSHNPRYILCQSWCVWQSHVVQMFHHLWIILVLLLVWIQSPC